jgi:hypothetical protein
MKVPDFSNVMGKFAFEIQEYDQKISVLGTQRGFVIQQRNNAVLEEFHAMVPEVEFGKTVVSHLVTPGGYGAKSIVRTGVAHEIRISESYKGFTWTLPIVHLTRFTAWDRKHWDASELEDSAKYNRRTTHSDPTSHISVGDEFKIVGEVVSEGEHGLYEVKFHAAD